MNKKFLLTILLVILIGVGTGAFLLRLKSGTPESDTREIVIGDRDPYLTFIAIKKGFFEDENIKVIQELLWEPGLDVSIINLQIEALDYASFSDRYNYLPIEASLQGTPVKTIMFTGRDLNAFIVAQPGLTINDIRSIGINFRHNAQHYLALKFIEKHNLKDVEIIAPKPREGRLTTGKLMMLLLENKVDAILGGAVIGAYDFETRKGFPILAILDGGIPTVLTTGEGKIVQNPKEIQKVIRAYERAMNFVLTEPEETKKLILEWWEKCYWPEEIKKLGWEKLPEDYNLIAEKVYLYLKTTYDRRDVPYDEGAELLIQLVKAGEFETVQEVEEQVVTQEELDKVFDFRFVK